jgi:hypothetical protein
MSGVLAYHISLVVLLLAAAWGAAGTHRPSRRNSLASPIVLFARALESHQSDHPRNYEDVNLF